jgi:hypothetical protein
MRQPSSFLLISLLLVFAAMPVIAGDQRPSSPWGPPDIDSAVPPVDTASQCPVDDILHAASKRVKELVTDMQRFSATERIEFFEADKYGAGHMTAKAKFNYVAYIHEVRTGQLAVEEYRDDSVGVQSFPTNLATTGTAAFALILHPNYVNDFAFTCEGMSERDGRRAWQLRFAQKKKNNFHHYRVAGNIYQVDLKGRLWIDDKTHDVLRLETDLLQPMPEIPLLREHMIINYGDVEFRTRKVSLWLPQDADIYMDYRGKRYHHHHSFSDFQLFWIDTEQKDKAPAGH